MKAKCKCGREITDIHVRNACNEEREEYYEVSAECECSKSYEFSGWGDRTEDEAHEELQQFIDENKF